MKTKRWFYLSSIFALGSLLSSCASYSASPLGAPSPDLVFLSKQSDEISVVAHTFTKEECLRFLDRDVMTEGYQPVQISIENSTSAPLAFSLSRISLPLARVEEVAQKVHTSTVGRVVGYSVGSLILWPLVIPAIVDGIKSSNANDALDRDYIAKAAKDQIIFPHSRLNTLLFVPVHSYQDSFTLTLMDQSTNEPRVFQVSSTR